MKRSIPLLAALLLAVPLHAEPVQPPVAEAPALSEGVVRKIDAANGKLTLEHGYLANLDMPAMTMVFRVQSPELLAGVKVGDRVKFHAERRSGVFIVTTIQVQP